MKIINLKKDINNFLFEPKLQLLIIFMVDMVRTNSMVKKIYFDLKNNKY
tara:strand:+ start:532 stop:678 length:147 start_codon:yes stop_codon:yes gene_type:complete